MQIILGVLAVFLITASLFALLIHLGFRAPRQRESGTPMDHGLPYEEVLIPTVAVKRLFGWFLPAGEADKTIIVLHGWGGNAEFMLPLAGPLHQHGLNVLLFDARNHGSSDAHGFSSLPRFAEDLEASINWLQSTYPGACKKLALLGHSVGAGAVMLTASRRDDIAAVVTLGAFAHPEWVMRRYLQKIYLPRILMRLVNRYVQWVIGYRFQDIAPVNTVCKIRCPILLMHGIEDEVVPLSDAHAISAACANQQLKLHTIPEAGHTSVDVIELHIHKLLEFLQQAGLQVNKTGREQPRKLPD